MFEILITKPSKKLENEAKKAGFLKVFFIDQKEAILIETSNKEELRREISSLYAKKKKIIVLGSTDEINRIAVEDKRVLMLLSPEAKKTKDFMKYRNSGLNHVLCKLAAKNNVLIGISLDSIISTKGIERAEKLGRIMQNIYLCRKYKAKVILASFGNKPSTPYILKSLGSTLGMSTNQVKQSLENASKTF